MSRKSVSPSVNEVAFDCPHCGAYTTQTWFLLTRSHWTGSVVSRV
jgi:hypothetical protein